MRELKADIKDDVWIKGQVEEIRITAIGVKYKVNVFGITLEVFEEDLDEFLSRQDAELEKLKAEEDDDE